MNGECMWRIGGVLTVASVRDGGTGRAHIVGVGVVCLCGACGGVCGVMMWYAVGSEPGSHPVIRKNWNDTEKISMAPAQG